MFSRKKRKNINEKLYPEIIIMSSTVSTSGHGSHSHGGSGGGSGGGGGGGYRGGGGGGGYRGRGRGRGGGVRSASGGAGHYHGHISSDKPYLSMSDIELMKKHPFAELQDVLIDFYRDPHSKEAEPLRDLVYSTMDGTSFEVRDGLTEETKTISLSEFLAVSPDVRGKYMFSGRTHVNVTRFIVDRLLDRARLLEGGAVFDTMMI